MKQRLACVFNSAPHYRLFIYKKMIERFGCKFVFSADPVGNESIRQISEQELPNSLFVPIHKFFGGKIFSQKRVLAETKNADSVILGGDINCLSTWMMLLRSHFIGQRVYVWTHGWYGKESFGKKIVKRIFFGLATGVLLYGEYARNLMIKEGFDASKLSVIYNSLNYDKALTLRNGALKSDIYSSHFNNSLYNVVFIGRLTKVKRLDMLVNALGVLKSFNLIFVGDGEMAEVLKRQAKELGVEPNVWFWGACYDENKIAELLYNADVCVSPGNVGLTALHAFSYGTPVITHDNYAMQMPEYEIIEAGETGAFYKFEDANALCDSIKTWLELKAPYRQEIRNKCYSAIDKCWNPDYQVTVIEKILRQ